MSNVLDFMKAQAIDMKPLRIEESMTTSIRLVQYPSGIQTLQGAYKWVEGFKTGFVWKDLPVIWVDSDGQEFDND